MVQRYTSNTDVKKFVFLTEQEFIMYFGQHYESSVLKANETKQDVIRIKNANGITSSIPIERANYLLEKYYRALKKKAALAASSDPNAKSALVLDTETSEIAAKTIYPQSQA